MISRRRKTADSMLASLHFPSDPGFGIGTSSERIVICASICSKLAAQIFTCSLGRHLG